VLRARQAGSSRLQTYGTIDTDIELGARAAGADDESHRAADTDLGFVEHRADERRCAAELGPTALQMPRLAAQSICVCDPGS
jgi:hypothetical protein